MRSAREAQNRLLSTTWATYALASLLGGCVAFNPVCARDNSETVGETLQPLLLQETTLRTQETPVGNLLADALLAELPSADLALIPAAAFERQTSCGARDMIDRGVMQLNDIEALLPSDASVVLLSLTTEDLMSILERSVSALSNTSALGEMAGAPYFLQVGRLSFQVDCAGSPQILNDASTMIVSAGSRVIADSLRIGNLQPVPGQALKLATLSSLTQNAWGYTALATPGRLLTDTHKTSQKVLTDYLRQNIPVDPAVDGRILLSDSCIQ